MLTVKVYFSIENHLSHDNLLEVTTKHRLQVLSLAKIVPKVLLDDSVDFYSDNRTTEALITFEYLHPYGFDKFYGKLNPNHILSIFCRTTYKLPTVGAVSDVSQIHTIT